MEGFISILILSIFWLMLVREILCLYRLNRSSRRYAALVEEFTEKTKRLLENDLEFQRAIQERVLKSLVFEIQSSPELSGERQD